jgi:hypothetical protein
MRRAARGRRRAGVAAVFTAAVVIALGGCTSVPGAFSGPPPRHGGPPVTYVALGEQLQPRTTDPRRLWQDVFQQSALPYWATTYLVALDDSWQADPEAVARQVADLNPTVISLDVGVEEASAGEHAAEFSASLGRLLDAFESRHVPTILVANLLPAGAQPNAVPTRAQVAGYDSAIAADSRAAGAVLVDIHAALVRSSAAGDAVTSGGMLTPLGGAVVAEAFEAAVRRRPLSAAAGDHGRG